MSASQINHNQNQAPAARQPALDPLWPVVLVVAAVCFNALLAIINAHVYALSSREVILAEVAIVAAAHLFALQRFSPAMAPWYLLIVFAGLFALLRMATVGAFEVKYFRDLLIIPTFILLGLASSERRAVQAIIITTLIVLAGVILEALSVDAYAALFKIQDYYINTRGLVSADFTYEGSELFTSATRYQDRYIPFFGLHRLSSVFLEPVSLGNFTVLLVGFAAAFWGRFDSRAKWFVVLATLLILAASDGRLAMAATASILAVVVLSPLAPKNIAVAILPVVIVASIAIVITLNLHSGRDDIPGRLAYTVELMADMGPMDYLGLSDRLLAKSVDSGIVYLIITQSVVLMAALWLLITLGLNETSSAQRHYKNALCLYLALTMMVSYSFISIKTAAPLWFLYGTLAASAARATSRPMTDAAGSPMGPAPSGLQSN